MTKRTIIIAIVSLFLLTGILGCAPTQNQSNVSFKEAIIVDEEIDQTLEVSTSQTSETDTSPDNVPRGTYKFGVTPWQKGQTVDDIRSFYKPMLEWLSQETGHEFVILGAEDYEQMSTFLADGTVDLASISPAPFVAAQEKNPEIKMLVTELSQNADEVEKTDSYLGYMLTLKSNQDINSLEDLAGKKFGFVSKESTSGFLIPNVILQENEIDDYEAYFGQTFFLGSHPRVTDAIAAGSIDAGATWDFNWKQAIEKHGDIFKPVLTSPPIPNLGIAVHPSVSLEEQQKIQEALLKIDEDLLEGIPAAGYVVKPDSFYDIIRTLVASTN